VRPLDLPGHGYREEGEAIMGRGALGAAPPGLQSADLEARHLADAESLRMAREARAKLVGQLVDEIEALTAQPCAARRLGCRTARAAPPMLTRAGLVLCAQLRHLWL
jgi:hypothetical protein